MIVKCERAGCSMTATVTLGVPVLGLVVEQVMCSVHGRDAAALYEAQGLGVSAVAVSS